MITINSWQKSSVVASITAIYLWLVSFWVPIVAKDYSNYRNANLFQEFAPRALLGTLASALGLDQTGFNQLLLGAQFVQLLIILLILWNSVFRQSLNYRQDAITFFGVGFIFAFSTVTFLTFGPAGLIDVAAYALVACAALVIYRNQQSADWTAVAAVNCLMIVAVMIHEKSLFDLAILATWLFWKSGLRKTLVYLAPATITSLLFLAAVSSEKTSGLSPAEYFTILTQGLTFLRQWSLNVWGIIIGGGSIWILYSIFARQFVVAGISRSDARHRFFLVIVMVLICLSALLVACDTSRVVALIWLPTFLLMQEIDVGKIFRSRIAQIGLLGLCLFQLLLPPALIYNNGIAPFNCYGVRLITRLQLPMQRDIQPDTMGPFGLYIINHPQIMGPIIERCLPASDK